jgi:hypothetical protein
MGDHDVVADFDGEQEQSPRSKIINTLAEGAAQGRQNKGKPGRQILKRDGGLHQHLKFRFSGKLQRELKP